MPPHENDLPPCTNCGTPLWGPMLITIPMHNEQGHHYMARCCPDCREPIGGIIISKTSPLREELRQKSVPDPSPDRYDFEEYPPTSELVDG